MARIGRIPTLAGRGSLLATIAAAVALATVATWTISSTPADAPGPDVEAGPAAETGTETADLQLRRSELRITDTAANKPLALDKTTTTPFSTAQTAGPSTAAPDLEPPTAPSTTSPPTTAPPTTAPPTTAAASTVAPTAASQPVVAARFATLPPGSPLPDGATCAARVRPTPENVPENEPYNRTRGRAVSGTTYLSLNTAIAPTNFERRVDGDFVGSTDEIIQWGACKWGFDEDHVRAQAYAESGWFAGQWGDCGEQAQPATGGNNGCSSVGLLQVRAAGLPDPAYPGLWPMAKDSTAMNVDYALAIKRLCFEGHESWLAQVADSGVPYQAGDEWGCVGRWFSGDWWDSGAKAYVDDVQALLQERKWETRFVGCPGWRNNEHCSNGGPRGF